MEPVILLFGLVISLAGVAILVKPDYVFGIIGDYADSIGLHIFAVVVRVILGVALLLGASESKFPAVLEILGWFTLIAAGVLGAMGRDRFKRLIRWAIGLGPFFRQVAGGIALFFGCFLLYAAF